MNTSKLTPAQDTRFIKELQRQAGNELIVDVICYEEEKGGGFTVLASELACWRIANARKIGGDGSDHGITLRGRVAYSDSLKSFFYGER